MIKLKPKLLMDTLLGLVIASAVIFVGFASHAAAIVPTSSSSTTTTTTSSGATCNSTTDWYCQGACNFAKNPEVAKNPQQVASCQCNGSPDLTPDQLKACQNCHDKGSQQNCLANNPITKRINQIIYILSGLVAIVITGSLMYAGIQYAVSGESAGLVQAAKQRMINSGIALILFILTFSLLQWLIPGGL